MKRLSVSVVVMALAISGCATRGANYVPLVDSKNKSQAQISQDTVECQAFARQRASAGDGAMVGAIFGALVGVALSPGSRYNGYMAGNGALAGGAAGAAGANETQETIIKRCLVGRGYNVLN